MSEKVRAVHLQRRATVYLRQSTLQQVHHHGESTRRQYALKQRALQLGWPEEAVDILDEDLGQSGGSAAWRTGFQRLAEDVAHGRTGAVFALEVSRLARSSADWHRLLEVCGLADVLIADETSVYSPADYNDRLLLGLKGTMSEAESYWLRLRLQGGKLSKARRGALYQPAPVGYEWDADAERFRLDADEGVQRAVRLVFERFRLEGTAHGVVRYLASQGLQLPVRDVTTHEVCWRPAAYGNVVSMLHSPVYAGTYVYGRREQRMGLVDGQLRRVCSRTLPQESWKVCLKGHHAAYIPWEEYVANQKRLSGNHANYRLADVHGAARRGEALLQGLVLCGKCGRRMWTRYHGGSRHPVYTCPPLPPGKEGSRRCFSTSVRAPDAAVTSLFLAAVQPSEVELSLAVTREVEKQAAEVKRQWALRLERAAYEVRLAERRYKAVDPDKRHVARTLEAEWNQALSQLEELERQHQDALAHKRLVLTEEDRRRLLALARDLPAVWRAPTTTQPERKHMLRLMVREVVLRPEGPHPHSLHVQVVWQTGALTTLLVPRTPAPRLTTPPQALAAIAKLMDEGHTDAEAADSLNQQGLHTATGQSWDSVAEHGS